MKFDTIDEAEFRQMEEQKFMMNSHGRYDLPTNPFKLNNWFFGLNFLLIEFFFWMFDVIQDIMDIEQTNTLLIIYDC